MPASQIKYTLECLPNEMLCMIGTFLDPKSWLNWYSVLSNLDRGIGPLSTSMCKEFIRQSSISRKVYQPTHDYYWDMITIRQDIWEHERMRKNYWELFIRLSLGKVLQEIQEHITQTLSLIKCSTLSLRYPKRDRKELENQLLLKVMKEFSVDIVWKGGKYYEGSLTPPNGHRDVCYCTSIFSYPREALRVEVNGIEYTIDLEGYILALWITGGMKRVIRKGIVHWFTGGGFMGIDKGKKRGRMDFIDDNQPLQNHTERVRFIEGLLYNGNIKRRVSGRYPFIQDCNHNFLMNVKQDKVLEVLSRTIPFPEAKPQGVVCAIAREMIVKGSPRTLFDPITKTRYESTFQRKFLDGSAIYLLKKATSQD